MPENDHGGADVLGAVIAAARADLCRPCTCVGKIVDRIMTGPALAQVLADETALRRVLRLGLRKAVRIDLRQERQKAEPAEKPGIPPFRGE